jgi:ABC-type transport system involved in multi-copper enzyme maturation permease subunit
MIWLAWRQFRTQALVTFGLLAAFGALALVTGLHLHDVYSSLGGANCRARNDCYALTNSDKALQALLGPVLLAIPALLGMFWGAPLLARELESGTYRLAWTQSITRRRWLTVRVVLVGVAALAVAGLASWLVSWWLGPLDAVNVNRFAPSVFTARGVVAIGYTGFAFALGVAAGGLARRTLPAMVATLLGFIAVRVAFTLWVRPNLLSSSHAVVSLTAGKGVAFVSSSSGVSLAPGSPPIPNAWMVSAALVDHGDHPLSTAQLHDLLVRTCPTITTGSGDTKGLTGTAYRCLQTLSDRLHQLVGYQPPGHYWPLQALETGTFLAGALALIGVTVWLVGRRRGGQPALGESRQRSAKPSAREVGVPVRLPEGNRR